MRHSQHWRKRLPLEDKCSLSRLIPNSTIFTPILATPTCCARWDCRSDLFLERRRPRHPHPETSQGGVREIAVTPLVRYFSPSCAGEPFPESRSDDHHR